MIVPAPPKVVLLGMMTRMPVAGVVWQTVHYLVGLRRLGYDVHYVEAHAHAPSMLMRREEDDGGALAAAFIDRVVRRFDLGGRWAYQALHADGRCHGMSEGRLQELYREAALLINLHGGTAPLPEHAATGRLVYLGTDPVQTEVELAQGNEATVAFLEPHCAFFTFGENYGRPDCGVPVSSRFEFRPTRQPVVLEFWEDRGEGEPEAFTTVGSWKQAGRDIRWRGELYRWSKHHEFLKFAGLPEKVPTVSFELAITQYAPAEQALLERHGWRVRDALAISGDIDSYRGYIVASGGEFTVAKDQNVRLRSGCFSHRSATYLAAGRPVVTQDTGFGSVLPNGKGLFAFSTLDEVVAAIEAIRGDYRAHSLAAREAARACFDHRVVLGRLLEAVGLPARVDTRGERAASVGGRLDSNPPDGPDARSTGQCPPAFPADLVIQPVSRRPLRLPDETVQAILGRPLPGPAGVGGPAAGQSVGAATPPRASIVVVTIDKLALTRLCLESLRGHTEDPSWEVIVVDNGSTDGTTDYLLRLARREPRIRLQLNGRNLGFAAATNVGLSMAAGEVLVLLNNDTIVPPGWLSALCRHLERGRVGAVGPVTNRIGNEAQVEAPYRTYGGFLEFAAARARRRAGEAFDIPALTMFCFAMRRDVYARIGALDEGFGIGTLEDDDYSLRLTEAGYALVCADDVFVHHFGQASFGDLVAEGTYDRVLRESRRRFEEKWGRPWRPCGRRPGPAYQALVGRIRRLVPRLVPEGATVLVASRGDDELLDLEGREGWHFPQAEGGVWAGHYPADSRGCVEHLEALKERGAGFLLIPRTGLWWLDHYPDFALHLENRYHAVHRDSGTCLLFALDGEPSPDRRLTDATAMEETHA